MTSVIFFQPKAAGTLEDLLTGRLDSAASECGQTKGS